MDDDTPADERNVPADDLNGWDIFHFTIASTGFFLAISGAVLSSVCIGVLGLAILAWGMAYFTAHNVAT